MLGFYLCTDNQMFYNIKAVEVAGRCLLVKKTNKGEEERGTVNNKITKILKN